MEIYGYTSFVLLIPKEDFFTVSQLVEKNKDIIDISCKPYEIDKYYFVEIGVMDGSHSNKAIAKYIFESFPYICIKQSGSTYIVAKDKGKFRQALIDMFTPDRKIHFIYNMLSIDERYDICETLRSKLDNCFTIRMIRWIGGNKYSLMYEIGRPEIFSNNPEVDLSYEDYSIEETVDLLEGLSLYKFHVGILSEKLEK